MRAEQNRPWTVGTVGSQLTPKTREKAGGARKNARGTSIFPGFSGETTILLTPTDHKVKRVEKTATCQGTVGWTVAWTVGVSRGAVLGDEGSVADSTDPSTVQATVQAASTASQANGNHTSNGGSESRPRGTPPWRAPNERL